MGKKISRARIRAAINSGIITYNKGTVYFSDGHAIGGILAKNKSDIIEKIYICIQREGFSTPKI